MSRTGPLLLAAALAAAAAASLGLGRAPAPCTAQPPLAWFERTAEAVRGLPDASASRTWAIAWTAADTAGQQHPEQVPQAVEGAVATVLEQQACGEGEAVRAGERAARALLDARAGDGLSPEALEGTLVLPRPGTGVWRPTPPDGAPAGSVRLGRARPFLLTAPDELRPLPPAPVGSARYVRDLEEVRRLGSADSDERTPEQTAVARFWEASSVTVLTDVVRQVAPDLEPARLAALLADLHRTTTDTVIAVHAAKYEALRWRPVSAITRDGDGDPRTLRDRHWRPLSPTPPNPEHPGGHSAYAAAAAAVLTAHLGPRTDVLVDSPTGAPRRYTRWEQLVAENDDGRVWAGLHLRSSDEAGSDLGRRVARTALSRVPSRDLPGTPRP